jgi:hypothetical protein
MACTIGPQGLSISHKATRIKPVYYMQDCCILKKNGCKRTLATQTAGLLGLSQKGVLCGKILPLAEVALRGGMENTKASKAVRGKSVVSPQLWWAVRSRNGWRCACVCEQGLAWEPGFAAHRCFGSTENFARKHQQSECKGCCLVHPAYKSAQQHQQQHKQQAEYTQHLRQTCDLLRRKSTSL